MIPPHTVPALLLVLLTTPAPDETPIVETTVDAATRPLFENDRYAWHAAFINQVMLEERYPNTCFQQLAEITVTEIGNGTDFVGLRVRTLTRDKMGIDVRNGIPYCAYTAPFTHAMLDEGKRLEAENDKRIPSQRRSRDELWNALNRAQPFATACARGMEGNLSSWGDGVRCARKESVKALCPRGGGIEEWGDWECVRAYCPEGVADLRSPLRIRGCAKCPDGGEVDAEETKAWWRGARGYVPNTNVPFPPEHVLCRVAKTRPETKTTASSRPTGSRDSGVGRSTHTSQLKRGAGPTSPPRSAAPTLP